MGMIGDSTEGRVLCEESRNMLRELTRIHVKIDALQRRVRANEPEWILRLRKVCLHAVAISKWGVGVDDAHVMATELRAVYLQMAAIWKRVPSEFRIDGVDPSWWADEARNGLLAAYDHPTPLSLAFPLAEGGFGGGDNPKSYMQFAVWLGKLGVGYGLTLGFLAQVLGAEGDIDARLAAVLSTGLANPA